MTDTERRGDPGFQSCIRCKHWLRERRTEYESGDTLVTFKDFVQGLTY